MDPSHNWDKAYVATAFLELGDYRRPSRGKRDGRSHSSSDILDEPKHVMTYSNPRTDQVLKSQRHQVSISDLKAKYNGHTAVSPPTNDPYTKGNGFKVSVSERKAKYDNCNENCEIKNGYERRHSNQKESTSETKSVGNSSLSLKPVTRSIDARRNSLKPSFIIKPRKQFVSQGDIAKFKASCEGEPPPTLHWEHSGRRLSTNDKYKVYNKSDFHYLEVHDVNLHDGGDYICTIENQVGSCQENVQLEIFGQNKSSLRKSLENAGPKFEKRLEDQTVREHQTLNLECTLTGYPEPQVTWYKDDKQLRNIGSVRKTFDGKKAKIAIWDVSVKDYGKYECVASNCLGEDRTNCLVKSTDGSHNLRKETGIPSKSLITGTNHFHSNSLDGSQPKSTHLNRSSKISKIMERYQNSQSNNDVKDERNAVQSQTKLTATSHEQLPLISTHLSNVTVAIGEQLHLQCTVLNGLNCTVCWYHNDCPVIPTELICMEFDGSVAKVQILNVKKEDAGNYLCVFSCESGKAVTAAKVNVIGCEKKQTVPDLPTSPKDATEKHTSTHTLEVMGAKPAEISFTFPCPEENANEVVKSEAEMRDSIHTLVSENNNNVVSQNPVFITKPKSMTTKEGGTVMFTCRVDSLCDSKQVLWKKDDDLVSQSHRVKISDNKNIHKLEISKSVAKDAGKYSVTAVNSSGEETCIFNLTVQPNEQYNSDYTSLLKSRSKLKDLNGASSKQQNKITQHDFRSVLKSKTNHVENVDKQTKQTETVEKADHTAERKKTNYVVDIDKQTKEPETVEKADHTAERKKTNYVVDIDKQTKKPETIEIANPKAERNKTNYAVDIDKQTKEPETVEKADHTAERNKTNYVVDIDKQTKKPETVEIANLKAERYKTNHVEDIDKLVKQTETVENAAERNKKAEGLEKDRKPLKRDSINKQPPFIEDVNHDNLHVVKGSTIELQTRFVGDPLPNVRWCKVGQLLKAGGRFHIETTSNSSTLVIENCVPDDTGKYYFLAENDIGDDRITATVTVEDRPNAPVGKPAATCVTSTSATLSWYGPNFDGRCQVTDYMLEMFKLPDGNWQKLTQTCQNTSYQVTELSADTEYQFRVRAGNKHGFSEPSLRSEIVSTKKALILPGDISPSPFLSPLSPDAFMTDELSFEPKVVRIDPSRKFEEYYDKHEEIGKGKFGNVYKCFEKTTGRPWAAKIIKCRPSQKKEMKQEIEVMNKLQHPKLLLLWDAFECSNRMVLVMEHVSGGELFERIIDDDYILTERECIHFMKQVCEGVRYMHSKNILHLDLKPENILCITKNSNEIKLIDFGLARPFDPAKECRVLFGTPEFVAPEVINYDIIGYETDMWSVGVICYTLLSGLSPFLGDLDSETLAKVTMAEYDFDDEVFDEISDDAKNFIEGLLQKKKEKRLSAESCLGHRWMVQDVKVMKAKRLSTEKHKRFMARAKWQKTGNAIRALGRLSLLKKSMPSSAQDGNRPTLDDSRRKSAPAVVRSRAFSETTKEKKSVTNPLPRSDSDTLAELSSRVNVYDSYPSISE